MHRESYCTSSRSCGKSYATDIKLIEMYYCGRYDPLNKEYMARLKGSLERALLQVERELNGR